MDISEVKLAGCGDGSGHGGKPEGGVKGDSQFLACPTR